MGFTDLSDTDESLIDQIISEAKDACVLEQISSINCSSFSDSVLPTHLESRFHKLKSLPLTKAHTFSTTHFTEPPNGDHKSPDLEDPNENTQKGFEGNAKSELGSDQSSIFSQFNSTPDEEKCKKQKPVAKAKSDLGSDQSSIFSQFKSDPDEEKCKKKKPESGSLSSPLSISNSSMSSPSPPRKFGCFWCSPKKDSSSSKKKKKNKKKSKENWWDKSDDEFLSELGSFSSKKQKEILKKAMKEEQKVSLEAEKIVHWAKHVSARMNDLDIDDELSDH